jgi:hypothetical protein
MVFQFQSHSYSSLRFRFFRFKFFSRFFRHQPIHPGALYLQSSFLEFVDKFPELFAWKN